MLRVLFILMLSTALFLSAIAPAAGQSSKDETEQRLRVLQDQITLTTVRISETDELEQASLETLNDLDRQIALREELISTNQRLLSQTENTRDSLAASLSALEEELSFHRGQYQKRAKYAYKYGRLHDVALILAAQSINQMLIRIRYLNRFAEQRRSRLNQIIQSTNQISERRKEIDENAEKARELIEQYSGEQNNLKQLRSKRRQIIQELQRQRESLQEELETKQQEQQQLERMVRQIITNDNNRRASAPSNPVTDAANAELSSSFFASQGSLPWPAEGAIIEPFGTVINPVYGTETYNPGILISTTPSAEVTSIYEGEVVEIISMPDFGKVISISHGEYTSLYGNLSLLYVSTGTMVGEGQLVGRAGTDTEPKGNAVFFALFRNGLEVNPESWLRSR